MLLKISLEPQRVGMGEYSCAIDEKSCFVTEVVSFIEIDERKRRYNLNPKFLSILFDLRWDVSLLCLVKKDDFFTLELQPVGENGTELEGVVFDVKSVEEVVDFPPVHPRYKR